MACSECNAFLANYQLAAELYKEVTTNLMNLAAAKDFVSPEFLRLKQQAQAVRHECIRAKQALQIHKKGHGIV
jgi:hypothetical protein